MDEFLFCASLLVAALGATAYLYHLVGLLLMAFQENFWLGLAGLVFQVPLVLLAALRWDRVGSTFLRAVASLALTAGGLLAAYRDLHS